MTADEDKVRIVITRLARPHASGGYVIGRAAMLAEGGDFPALKEWVLAHGGMPETTAPAAASRGLHGSQREPDARAAGEAPQYVLPASALA